MEKLKELIFLFNEMLILPINEKTIISLKDINKEINNIISRFENTPKKLPLIKVGDKAFVIKGRGHSEGVFGEVVNVKDGVISIFDEKTSQEIMADEAKVIVAIFKV